MGVYRHNYLEGGWEIYFTGSNDETIMLQFQVNNDIQQLSLSSFQKALLLTINHFKHNEEI